MSMNLIQTQERLKDVPLQAVMQYVNGMNPEVPPYMALSELDRRKRIQQQAQAQAPQGTVKDQLEQQVGGVGGLMPPGAQMPGQATPQGAPQGAPQGMPPGMAQRGMPPGMPPQGAPVQAAGGGLMSLMGKRYARGGMVAFARGEEVEGDDGDEESTGPVSMTPAADLAEYKRMMASKLGEKVRETLSPLEQRKKMMAEDPEAYGMLAKKPGEEYLTGIQAMLQQREAEAEKQRGENSRLKELGTYAALSQAAEATRGMRGGKGSQIAAMLGSFGQQMGGVEKESIGRDRSLREDLLKRQELQNAAKFEVEKLQMARAEGDVQGEQKHTANLAKIENELRVSQNSLLKGAITGAYGAAGKALVANISAKSREKVAQDKIEADKSLERMRAGRPGEKERLLARVQKLRADGKPEEAEQLMKDIREMQGGAAGVGADKNTRLVITEQLRSRRADLKSAESPEEEAAIKAEIAELNDQLKNLGPKSDRVTPIALPQPMPDGLTKANASQLLKVGTVYETAKGPGKWNGKSFDSVK
jgi:hypothetical protein